MGYLRLKRKSSRMEFGRANAPRATPARKRDTELRAIVVAVVPGNDVDPNATVPQPEGPDRHNPGRVALPFPTPERLADLAAVDPAWPGRKQGGEELAEHGRLYWPRSSNAAPSTQWSAQERELAVNDALAAPVLWHGH